MRMLDLKRGGGLSPPSPPPVAAPVLIQSLNPLLECYEENGLLLYINQAISVIKHNICMTEGLITDITWLIYMMYLTTVECDDTTITSYQPLVAV